MASCDFRLVNAAFGAAPAADDSSSLSSLLPPQTLHGYHHHHHHYHHQQQQQTELCQRFGSFYKAVNPGSYAGEPSRPSPYVCGRPTTAPAGSTGPGLAAYDKLTEPGDGWQLADPYAQLKTDGPTTATGLNEKGTQPQPDGPIRGTILYYVICIGCGMTNRNDVILYCPTWDRPYR